MGGFNRVPPAAAHLQHSLLCPIRSVLLLLILVPLVISVVIAIVAVVAIVAALQESQADKKPKSCSRRDPANLGLHRLGVNHSTKLTFSSTLLAVQLNGP